MKIYVNEMPRSCAECDRFCLDENGRFRCILNSMPDYRSQEEKETARRNDCPLNSIQTLLAEKEKEQNQIAIGQLEKAKEIVKHFCEIHSDDYYGVKSQVMGIRQDVFEFIDQQIKQLKERWKNEH